MLNKYVFKYERIKGILNINNIKFRNLVMMKKK